MSVIDFSNSKEEVNNTQHIEDMILQQNEMYLEGILDRMNTEYKALARTDNQQAMMLGNVIRDMVTSIIDRVTTEFRTYTELYSKIQAPYFLNQCMQSINAIFAGGIISPLTGSDEEWMDTTVPEDIGQDFKIAYRGKEFSIKIESVQVNIRYPKIYRLNGDNKFAHRIDYFQFHNAANPEHVHLTPDSIRFIQFPYMMQALHSHCIVENNKITDYLDFDYDDITNGLIYPDPSNTDPHSFIIAPKIPFFMLEEEGIHLEEEISKYQSEIDEIESQELVDDSDNTYGLGFEADLTNDG